MGAVPGSITVQARVVSKALGLVDVQLTDPDRRVREAWVEVMGRDGAIRRVALWPWPEATEPTNADGSAPTSPTPNGSGAVDLLGRGGAGRWGARVGSVGLEPGARAVVEARLEDGGRRGLSVGIGPEPLGWEPPAWAMGRVWYQVFPERFRNGTPANDPRGPVGAETGWTEPWWAVQTEEIEAAWARRLADPRANRYRPDDLAGALGQVVFARRYGGDLQGVVERLDHLVALGVDGLYLCPVFTGMSLHKYDAADHRHVDPALGGSSRPGRFISHDPGETEDPATWRWTEADRYLIDVLLPEAKRRGLRVMLDGVWNHVGVDHWAFADVARRGRDSAYAGWFNATFDDAGRLNGWAAWDGRNGDLPSFRQTEAGDLAPGPKAHVMAVTRRWMDPNGDGDPSDGIDGWRLDVAAEIGRAFWKDWRAEVKSINPGALIIAELWEDGSRYYDGTAFDGQMNYPFAFAATAWLGREPGTTGRAMAGTAGAMWGVRPAVDLVQMTLLASHDTERLASMMDNPGRAYDRDAGTAAVMSGAYRAGPASGRGRRLSVLGAAMQAAMPGSPMIYGGDELGLAGPDDPHNRQPVIWEDQAGLVEVARRPSGSVVQGYQTWLGLRHDAEIGPVLRYGDVKVWASDRESVLIVERQLDDRRVFVVFNRGDSLVCVGEIVREAGVLGLDREVMGLSAVVVVVGAGE